MKNYILSIITIVSFASTANAQIGIETTDVGDGAILDFPDNATKGILLPRTDGTGNAGNVSGTLLFDHTDDTVKYYHDNQWVSMTAASNKDVSGHDLATYPETSSNGVKLEDGTGGTAADGVLSLASNERALALPKVNGVETLASPQAGMICYDLKKKALAIFNGEVWTFWD